MERLDLEEAPVRPPDSTERLAGCSDVTASRQAVV